jgi:hypothetical protein
MKKTTKKPTSANAKKGSIEDFPDFSTGAEFDALSAEDKEKVARYYEQGRHRSELRPLNAKERAEVKREHKKRLPCMSQESAISAWTVRGRHATAKKDHRQG